MKTRKRPGQTLIEVTMATLVAAITTTAVFSVVLSSYVSDSKADKRDAAAMVLRRAQDTLKSYVSADPTNSAYVPSVSGTGLWTADSLNVWALRGDGLVHDISSLVSGPPLTVPGSPAATLRYTVFSYDCGFGLGTPPNYPRACKRVVFNLTYTD